MPHKGMTSLDEFIKSMNTQIKASDHGAESPIEKIDRMFADAIKKAPQHADEIKMEWKKLSDKQKAKEITNLDFQIKEILNRYNVAYMSEAETATEDNSFQIPGNKYNEKSKSIRTWIEEHMDDYNLETEHEKIMSAVLKYFKMEDKTAVDKDEFLQLVNINLEQ